MHRSRFGACHLHFLLQNERQSLGDGHPEYLVAASRKNSDLKQWDNDHFTELIFRCAKHFYYLPPRPGPSPAATCFCNVASEQGQSASNKSKSAGVLLSANLPDYTPGLWPQLHTAGDPSGLEDLRTFAFVAG